MVFAMTVPLNTAPADDDIVAWAVVVPLTFKASVAVRAPPKTAGDDEDSVPFTIVTAP